MIFFGQQVSWYSVGDRVGVAILAVAALISLLSVLGVLLFKCPKRKTFRNTHIWGYLISLLAANVFQALGTLINIIWAARDGIYDGAWCTAQGAIKQFGNVATAMWACQISVHLFNLLFMRMGTTTYAFWGTFVFGWGLVLLIIIIGPTMIQKPELGPYFGPSGAWCWITSNYGTEQIFLEYFLEYFAAVTSFILAMLVLLRVRGNLVNANGRWRFRWIPNGESWKLAFSRDLLDTAMLSVSKMMVWFPVAYTLLLIPITITRISEFSGAYIPFGVTVFTDSLYNLTGLVNVILILMAERLFPELDDLPQFNTPRNEMTEIQRRNLGLEPFTLERSLTAEKYRRERVLYIPYPERAHFPTFIRRPSQDSDASDASWEVKEREDLIEEYSYSYSKGPEGYSYVPQGQGGPPVRSKDPDSYASYGFSRPPALPYKPGQVPPKF